MRWLSKDREAEIRLAADKCRIAIDQLRASAAEIHRMWLLAEVDALRVELSLEKLMRHTAEDAAAALLAQRR